MVVRLRAIGECAIEVGGARVGPDAELAFAVLLVLVMARGHTVTRRRLTDLLWPGTPDDRARHNLRQTLYKLRQLGAPVESESLHVRLPADAVAPNPLLDADADGEGTEAGELLRADRPFGEFLAGYVPTFSPPFAAWIDEQRSVVHARLRRAALTRLHDERRRGAWAAVETLARKVLQLDALNEEATLALAEATVMSGSKRAAIALLDAYLRDLGADAGDIRLPATLLRRRIAERLPPSLSPPDGDPRFVGRAESMAFLHDQFRLARGDGARTVLVWGDAGIGKSRLTTEFARLAVMEGAQLARVGCQARDVERPLSIFVDVVPHLLALPGAIGCSPESMTYLRRLTAHDPTVLEPAAETREAELLFAYVRRSILDLVDAVAAESSLVLVFEDVHWLDEQSWRVLRELIGWLERRRVLVVMTSRLPHATPSRPARAAAGVVEHRLGPLDREASLALFDAATPGGAVPGEYREWCVQVADGNPLFLCELAARRRGGMASDIPMSIEQLLRNRIDALSLAAKQVLQCSATLGREATFERIGRMLAIGPQALLTALSENIGARLLGVAEGDTRCRHEVIATIVTRTITPEESAVLHQLAAATLEQDVETSRSVTLAWECVQHWTLANQPTRATRVAVTSARSLIDIGLPRDAATLLAELPATFDDPALRIACLEVRRDALHMSGEWTKLAAVLDDLASARSRVAGPPITTSSDTDTLLRLETGLRTGGDVAAVMASALAITRDRNATTACRVQAAIVSLRCADNQFDSRTAHIAHEAADALFRHTAEDTHAHRLRAIYHNGFGDIDTALVATEQWLVAERRTGDALTLSRALRNAAIPYRTAGDLDSAFATLTQSYELAVANQLASSAANSADVLATMNLGLGERAQATRWHRLAEFWSQHAEEPPLASSIQIVGLRLAIEEGHIDDCTWMLPFDQQEAFRDRLLRRRVDRLALLGDLLLARGTLNDAPQVRDELLRLHQTARHFHGHDYAASVLIRLLGVLNDDCKATSIACAYLAERRERGRGSAQLQRAVSSLRQPPAARD